MSINDQRGSRASLNTVLQGSTRRVGVKPALFFLESTFQVILNKKKDGPFWKVSGGVISRAQRL